MEISIQDPCCSLNLNSNYLYWGEICNLLVHSVDHNFIRLFAFFFKHGQKANYSIRSKKKKWIYNSFKNENVTIMRFWKNLYCFKNFFGLLLLVTFCFTRLLRAISSLTLLSGPLWPGVIAHVRFASMGQIDPFASYLYWIKI